MEFEFRQTQTDDVSLNSYSNLLSSVFKGTHKYTYEFLKWQYLDNPNGKVIGYDAFYENKLVAHYVTIPVVYCKNDMEYKGLLSLNTATDSQFQGKGLFTKLAERTYELGKNQGFQFVIGVANQNSTHGFVKKLGFKLVASLDAYIYLFDNKEVAPDNSVFKSLITGSTLQWRAKNPSNAYLFKDNCLYSSTDFRFIKACLSKTKLCINKSNLPICFKMVIGLGNKPSTIFKFKIPDKYKPSPLNLIVKELNDNGAIGNNNNIYFELIDFDAY